eukprot:TRINITY_DN2381_c0_g1_i1.p3 TRINITY_DN2381_c0_g1~~TRINITY_DN2381_c0_g1_i1.p3  ORF type:complete len:202 (-),score=-1.36 TRINITY_DN2381_c0_g1_i1:82-687(-)
MQNHMQILQMFFHVVKRFPFLGVEVVRSDTLYQNIQQKKFNMLSNLTNDSVKKDLELYVGVRLLGIVNNTEEENQRNRLCFWFSRGPLECLMRGTIHGGKRQKQHKSQGAYPCLGGGLVMVCPLQQWNSKNFSGLTGVQCLGMMKVQLRGQSLAEIPNQFIRGLAGTPVGIRTNYKVTTTLCVSGLQWRLLKKADPRHSEA